MSETLILNGKDLTLENLYSVVYDRRPVQIDPEVVPLVDKSRQVHRWVSKSGLDKC